MICPSLVIWFLQQMQGVKNFEASEPVVIIGFGQMGQVVFIFLFFYYLYHIFLNIAMSILAA